MRNERSTSLRRYVITGGPGAGKTSLIDSLAASGYTCIPEASRQLIQREVRLGTGRLPWQDFPAFAELCLQQMKADYFAAKGLTFYDRGIPDVLGYMAEAGASDSARIWSLARQHTYAPLVFVAPAWEAIYCQDAERWQTFRQAQRLDREIRRVYAALGYELVTLPLGTVEERRAFVLERVSHEQAPPIPESAVCFTSGQVNSNEGVMCRS
ncbi:putative ATPase [Dyadobacter jejuensis]|uniref:Putative ATPase n=1 Tax=Dyadobacter jejuensis TaxID=1082580 RepID=A0A316ABD7_9BACT|nr:AAA family ATPase [Dyadobacter jejuensis]PWJ55035.1 putative ATPase [Dyadobacter jejuensis]